MPLPKTGATQYHAQLGLPDKGCSIKGLVICNSWDLEPCDLVSSAATILPKSVSASLGQTK